MDEQLQGVKFRLTQQPVCHPLSQDRIYKAFFPTFCKQFCQPLTAMSSIIVENAMVNTPVITLGIKFSTKMQMAA